MKIAIIGAGIAGLTTAISLEKIGFSVQIYEQASEIRPVGAGITLAHNAMQVYDKLGLKDDISELGNPISSMNVTTPDLIPMSKVETKCFDDKYSVNPVAIHRGELQNLLVKKLKNTRIHLNKKLVEIKGGRSISLLFSDDTEIKFDAVIAADGINSIARNVIFKENTIRKANQMCWRGISDINLSSKYQSELNEAWGKGSRFGFVQISPGRVYWYALLNNNSEENTPNIFSYNFKEYHQVVKDIISRTDTSKIFKDEIQDLEPISSWVQENICLVGDAAHATTPNMGQGACQAIEDAYVLSHCLDNYPINVAFSRYEQLRMKKAKTVVSLSWRLGKISQLQNPTLIAIRNFSIKLIPSIFNRIQLDKIYKLEKLYDIP